MINMLRYIPLAAIAFAQAAVAAAPATPAPTQPASACDVAREYIRLTDEKQYDQVGELWADDAVFYSPMGVIIRGKPAIKEFYSRFLRTITPVNRISSLTFDPTTNVCVMELETRVAKDASGEWRPNAAGEFQRTAVDLFTINASGKVQQMRVYLAPADRWLK